MSVLYKTNKEIPSDAVILSEAQALEYQYTLLRDWKPRSDVWSFTIGGGVLGSFSAVTGILINHFYRRKLKLGSHGQFSTYLPIVVLPSIVSVLAHKLVVLPQIVLQKEKCLICNQTKAALCQATFGVIYPAILAPLAAYMWATRNFTYRLPSITEHPKEVFKTYVKMTKPISTNIGVAIGLQALVAMFITYKEMDQFYSVQLKLLEREKLFESYLNADKTKIK